MRVEQISRPLLAAAVFLAVACSRETVELTDVDEETATVEASDESLYEQGVSIVKFTEDMASLIEDDIADGNVVTKSSELNEFVDSYGITSIERVFSDDDRWLGRQHRAGLHLWYTVTFDENAITATKAAEGLGEIPGVQIAEPSPIIKSLSMNDTYYSEQWHLSSTYDINVEDVWANYTTGDSDVIISVVDTGISSDHPDLADNFVAAGEGGSKNFYRNNYSITADGHGTHVAGIIAAQSNNSLGVAGIAGGDYQTGAAGVKIMSCQIFSGENSASTSRTAEAIKWGADNGALICQNSWGYSYETEAEAAQGNTPQVIKNAIDYFIQYAGCDDDGNQLSDSKMKGGIVCFAAGNDGWQYGQPADYDPVIAVGATDEDGARASYSNYGDWVDICAPGTEIASTYYSNRMNGYAYASGTSMACPMVSGVAALVISYRGGQGFTCDDLKECLLSGASTDKVSATDVGPYLDALGAILYGLQGTPLAVESFTATAESNTINFSWEVTARASGSSIPAYGALLCASTSKTSIDEIDPANLTSDIVSTTVQTSKYAVGDTAEGSLTVDGFDTTYYVTVIPYNYGDTYAEESTTQSVTTEANYPPVISSSASTDDIVISAIGSFSTTFTVSEPDGHSFTVSYETGSVAESWQKLSTESYHLVINALSTDSEGNFVEPGTYTSKITAEDEYGAETELSFNYVIKENNAPTVDGEIGNVLFVLGSSSTASTTIDLSEYFSDPDGDELTYTVSNTSTGTVSASISGDSVSLTGRSSGSATVTVTASDPRGETAEQSISVVVRESDNLILMYPNPVKTTLYIGTLEEDETYIKIVSSSGATVYENTATSSAFEPAEVDMSGYAPGKYSVYVSHGETEATQTVAKI